MNKLLNNSKSFLMGILMAFLVIPLLAISSSATSNIDPVNTIKDTHSAKSADDTYSDVESRTKKQINEAIPNVSMNDAMNLVEHKTFDVVKLLQVFGKPFAMICMIGCALMVLVGAFGKGGYVGKGLLGMFISGVIYTAILYAPQIVEFFSRWLAS